MDLRLVAYAPNGARLGFLPQPLALDASLPLNDVPAMTVRYSRAALGGGILRRGLEQGLEVALQVNHSGDWVEPDGCRFVLIKRNVDTLDDSDVVTLTMPGYGWLLRKARLLDTTHIRPKGDHQEGKRAFLSATTGGIMAALMDENTTRGGVPLAKTFTSTKDSAGADWAKVVTLYLELGLDHDQILSSLTDQGMCDWTTRARELRLYNPDGVLARDVSGTVVLRLGRDVTEAPVEETIEGVVSTMLLRGDEGAVWTANNPSAPAPWGKWEGYISQGGVSDQGTAMSLVQSDLALAARVRGQYTRRLVLDRPGARSLPIRDYLPGDWVTGPTDRRSERVRVHQITLSRDERGAVTGSVVLNDRLVDADIRRTKRMRGIVGGSQADGGAGTRPTDPPSERDNRTPKAPTGLVVATSAFIAEDGQAVGRIAAQWDAVTEATDGTSMEIAGYGLWMRRDVAGSPWVFLTRTPGTTVEYWPLPPGERIWVAVSAIPSYSPNWSALSVPFFVVVGSDVEPPPVPSNLVLTVRLGMIRLEWDGLGRYGEAMPIDFARLEVEKNGHAGTFGTMLFASALVDDPPYGQPQQYRSRTVDRSGNASGWSEWVTGTTAPLVDADVILTQLNAAQTTITNIGQAAIESGVTLTEKLAQLQDTLAKAEIPIVSPNDPTVSDGIGRPAGALWVRTNTAGHMVNMWRWDDIASLWFQMPLSSTIIPQIQIGSGTAGLLDVSRLTATTAQLGTAVIEKLWADVVRSRKITTDMLIVSAGENIIPDPVFTSGLSGWNAMAGISWSATAGRNNGPAFVVNHTYGSARGVFAKTRVPVKGGGQYRLSLSIKASAAVSWLNINATLLFRRRDGSVYNVVMGPDPAGTFTAGQWTTIGYQPLSCPDDAVDAEAQVWFMQTAPTATYTIDLVSAARMTDASLIVDGGIFARHLTAGAVTTDKLAALVVTTDKLAANAVTADRIAAGAITAEKLDATAITGKTITGGSIYGAYIEAKNPNNNGKVFMSPYGIWANDPAGTTTFFLDSSTGQVNARGAFRSTDSYGYGVEMTLNAWGGSAGLKVTNPNLGVSGAIVAKRVAGGGYDANDFVIHGPETTVNSSGRAELVMKAGGTWRLQGLYTQVNSGVESNTSNIRLYGQDVNIYNTKPNGAGNIWLTSQQHTFIQPTGGAVYVGGGIGPVRLHASELLTVGLPATSGGFPLTISADWKVFYQGSSRTVKTDIHDAEQRLSLDAVKGLRPKLWRDRGEVRDAVAMAIESGAGVVEAQRAALASAGQYLGFLAEDMAALGLDQLVIQGGPEQVPGVAYDRVAAALVLWLRDHEQRLAALEGAPL